MEQESTMSDNIDLEYSRTSLEDACLDITVEATPSEDRERAKRGSKSGMNNFVKKAMKDAKKMSKKTKKFTKSAVAKIDTMPEKMQEKKLEEMKSDVKEDPKTIGQWIKKGAKLAGTAAVVGGLFVVGPLAGAAALAGLGIKYTQDKKQALRAIKHELIRLDGEITKADSKNPTSSGPFWL